VVETSLKSSAPNVHGGGRRASRRELAKAGRFGGASEAPPGLQAEPSVRSRREGYGRFLDDGRRFTNSVRPVAASTPRHSKALDGGHAQRLQRLLSSSKALSVGRRCCSCGVLRNLLSRSLFLRCPSTKGDGTAARRTSPARRRAPRSCPSSQARTRVWSLRGFCGPDAGLGPGAARCPHSRSMLCAHFRAPDCSETSMVGVLEPALTYSVWLPAHQPQLCSARRPTS